MSCRDCPFLYAKVGEITISSPSLFDDFCGSSPHYLLTGRKKCLKAHLATCLPCFRAFSSAKRK